jgi:hypothetical protein
MTQKRFIGSYGITVKSICRNESDLREAISMIRNQFHIVGAFLIQEFLEGTGTKYLEQNRHSERCT